MENRSSVTETVIVTKDRWESASNFSDLNQFAELKIVSASPSRCSELWLVWIKDLLGLVRNSEQKTGCL